MDTYCKTVSQMTQDERRKLDKKANYALIVSFLALFGAFLFLYGQAKYYRGDSSGSSSSGRPAKPPSPAARQHRSNFSDTGQGIDQRELDEMLKQGQHGQAKDRLNQLLLNNPNDWRANMQLGVLYFQLGDFDSALLLLEKAREQNPLDFFTVEVLGSAYTYKDPQKAVEFLREVYDQGRGNQDIIPELARALNKTAHSKIVAGADKEEYLPLLDESLEMLNLYKHENRRRIKQPYIELLKGENYYLQGDGNEAYIHYFEAFEGMDEIGDVAEKIYAATIYGWLNFMLEDYDRAQNGLENALAQALQWNEAKVERTIPRGRQLVFIIYTLFEFPDLYNRLNNLKDDEEEFIKAGVSFPQQAKIIKDLLMEMLEHNQAGDHKEALTTANEILEALDTPSSEGFMPDLIIINPLFRGSLLIQMGDICAAAGDKEEALYYYNSAAAYLPALQAITEDKIGKVNI